MTNFLYNAHCACPLNYFLFFCFLCLASLFLSIVHLQFFTFLQSSLLLYSPLFFGGSLLLSSSSIFSVLISTLLFQSILIFFHLIPSLFFSPILFSVLIYSPLLCSIFFSSFLLLFSVLFFYFLLLLSHLCSLSGRWTISREDSYVFFLGGLYMMSKYVTFRLQRKLSRENIFSFFC